jgi:hypothetical protein
MTLSVVSSNADQLQTLCISRKLLSCALEHSSLSCLLACPRIQRHQLLEFRWDYPFVQADL